MFISLSVLLRMQNVSDKSGKENQNTLFILNKVFSESYRFGDNLEKYGIAGQATECNV